MRIFLLPISTRRTLLYAHVQTQAQSKGLIAKVQNNAAKTWAAWEAKESGWQKMLVQFGNKALRTIPYEEWGLKSVPPLSAKRQDDELRGTDKVEVLYPQALIPPSNVTGVLHKLSTEREALHRQRFIWFLVAVPITAPFALVPIIPNIPGIYVAYRAWSHYRALAGGKHLQFLTKNQLLIHKPSPILDEVYSRQNAQLVSTPDSTAKPGEPKNTNPKWPQDDQPGGEMMLLDQASGKKMTQALELPQLELELERAIWQVERAIEKQNADRDAAAKKDDPKSQ